MTKYALDQIQKKILQWSFQCGMNEPKPLQKSVKEHEPL